MHHEDLIPRPPIVRERLAQALSDARLLKRLLRLSVDAAKERHRHAVVSPQKAARPNGVA
jgi:hypothetical protein